MASTQLHARMPIIPFCSVLIFPLLSGLMFFGLGLARRVPGNPVDEPVLVRVPHLPGGQPGRPGAGAAAEDSIRGRAETADLADLARRQRAPVRVHDPQLAEGHGESDGARLAQAVLLSQAGQQPAAMNVDLAPAAGNQLVQACGLFVSRAAENRYGLQPGGRLQRQSKNLLHVEGRQDRQRRASRAICSPQPPSLPGPGANTIAPALYAAAFATRKAA